MTRARIFFEKSGSSRCRSARSLIFARFFVSANGSVKVTYAWGDMGDMNPGIVDGQGKINAAGRLKLDRFPNGINVSFTMQQDGTLAGTYTVLEDPQPHTGFFTRQ